MIGKLVRLSLFADDVDNDGSNRYRSNGSKQQSEASLVMRQIVH